MKDGMQRRTIRTIGDLCAKVSVDRRTGCWNWLGASRNSSRKGQAPTPACWAVPPLRDKPGVISAAKAAWVLDGRTLEPRHVVWRALCMNLLCVNPAHCMSGTMAQMHAFLVATRRHQNNPIRAAINARSRLHMVTPLAVVREAEAMFAVGALQKDVRARFGMASETAKSIREGRHAHSANSKNRPAWVKLADTVVPKGLHLQRIQTPSVDIRYQMRPGDHIEGAGFAASGIGRYVR